MPDNTTPVVNPGDNSPWQPPLIINDPAVKMETIIIPETGMYPIEITINGFKRTLYARPGDEVEVPESVAAVLKNVKRPAPAEDGWKDAWATIRDAEKYGGGGGDDDEPTYETVAEIQVGEMTEGTDIYTYVFNDVAPLTIDTDETYYLNSADNPSTIVQNLNGILVIAFNADSTEELTPTDPNKPVFGVSWGEGKCRVMSDTDSFSNTTVKILKKVEQGGGGAGKLVVHLTESEVDGEMVYSADKAVAEIIAADKAGQVVECEFDGLRVPLLTRDSSGGVFACAVPSSSSRISNIVIVFDSDENKGDGWSLTDNELEIPSNLKPTYSFHFTIAAGSEAGTYVATPDTGVTYAAIRAALSETETVYALGTLPNGSTFKNLIIDDSGNSAVAVSGVFYAEGYVFTAYRLKVNSDDTCDIAIVALADAH